MEGRSKVQKFYLKGKQKYNEKKYQQSLNYFQRALQSFTSSDSLYLKAAILTNIAQAYKSLKQFDKSSDNYQKAIQFIQKSQRQLSQKQSEKFPRNQIEQEQQNLLQEKYRLFVSLALFKNEIADVENIQINSFDKYYSALKDSLKILGKAFNMVIKNLTDIYNGKQLDLNMNWNKEYINIIINVADALLIDALKFEDQKIFQKVIAVIEKGELFYNLICQQEQQQVKEIYSKGFYIKGASLLKIGQCQQSIKYLEKDYIYCYQNQKKQDMIKTRDLLILYYTKNRKYKQALNYAGNDKEKKQQIKNTETLTKKLLQDLKNIDNIQNQDKKQQTLIKFLDDIEDDSDWISETLIKKLESYGQSSLIRQKNTKFSIYYNLGRLKNKAKKYQDAYLSITEAKNYITTKKEQFFLLMIQSDSLAQIQTDKKEVQKVLKKCIELAYQLKNVDNINCCKENLKVFYIEMRRAESPLDHHLQDDSDLINHLKSLQQDLNKNDQSNKSKRKQNNKKSQLQRKSDQTITQKYQKQCKNVNILPRKVILDQLRRNSNNCFSFELFYNLEEEQLIILFKILPNLGTLKLLNHDISMKCIYQLSHSDQLKHTKQLSVKNLITYQSIKILVAKPQQLNELVLYKSYGILDIAFKKTKTSLSNILKTPNALIKLSLQSCKLKDQSLECICFSRMSSLQQLNLKGNMLHGEGLNQLSQLNYLLVLDLSQNPLKKYPIKKPCLITLKLCGLTQNSFEIQQQQLSKDKGLLQQICTVQQLDLSCNSSTIIQNILQGVCDYCTQKFIKIETLKKIYFNEITFTVQTCKALKRSMIVCPQLKDLIGKQVFGNIEDIVSLQQFAKDQHAHVETPNFINEQDLAMEKLF